MDAVRRYALARAVAKTVPSTGGAPHRTARYIGADADGSVERSGPSAEKSSDWRCPP
jgi:hypothetical protein